jgi:hypothetical protein
LSTGLRHTASTSPRDGEEPGETLLQTSIDQGYMEMSKEHSPG